MNCITTKDKSLEAVRERERELHFRDQKSGFVRQADTHLMFTK